MTSYPYEELKYQDFATMVQATVSVLTTTTEVLAANGGRQFACIQNVSVSQIQISFQNSTATFTNRGIKLTADNSFTLSKNVLSGMYTGAIYAKAPTTGRVLSVIYYNK